MAEIPSNLTLRLQKNSPLTYQELDDNFIYLNNLITALYRTSPLDVTPCSTFNWNSLISLNTQATYAYWAKQACTSSYPWWTGSNGKGILASETYSTLDPGLGYLGSVAFGQWNTLGGINTFAHGVSSSAAGTGAHAHGLGTQAQTAYSHTEGLNTFAQDTGSYSHAEGYANRARHQYSHVEGENTNTYSRASHAEGYQTQTGYAGISSTNDDAKGAHSEGRDTVASGSYSHTEGWWTTTRGWGSHAEGINTTSSHSGSHAEGWGTSTGLVYQHTTGRWNTLNNTDDFFVIGNGSSQVTRSNAFGVNATRTYISKSVVLPDLTNTPQTFVLTYNTSSKQVFFTASSAIGGGGGGGSALSILSQSVVLTSAATSINFTGSGVVATAVGNAVTVNIPGTINLPIIDETTLLTNSPSRITFSGSGVSASVVGNAVTVDVPLIRILDDYNFVANTITTLNFTGTGVSASFNSSTNNIDVNVPDLLSITDEGNPVTSTPRTLNFTGSGVSASLKANGIVDVYTFGNITQAVGSVGSIQLNDGNGGFTFDGNFTYNTSSQLLSIVGLYQQGSLRIDPRIVSANTTLGRDDYNLFINTQASGNITINFSGGTYIPAHGSILSFTIINNPGSTAVTLNNVTIKGVNSNTNPNLTNAYETLTIIYYDKGGVTDWYILDSYNSSIS